MACQVAVRVTPRSSKPGIGGWRKDADGRDELELRVAEAPADGAANAGIVGLVAVGRAQLGSPQRPHKRRRGQTEINYQGATS